MAANIGSGTNTPKYSVFRGNFDLLVTVVTQVLSEFATKAFSKKLIGKRLLNSATTINPATSATDVLRAILDKIKYNDSNFDTFIDILKEIPTLRVLADDLLADLRTKDEPPPPIGGLTDAPPRPKLPVVTDEDFDSGVSGMNTEQSNAASPNGNKLPERQSLVTPHDSHSSPTTTSGIQETHHMHPSPSLHDGMPKLEPAVDFKPSDHQSDRTHSVPVQAGAHVTASNTLDPSKNTDIPSEAEKPLVENDEPVGGLTMSTQASSSESIQGAVLIVPKKKRLLPRGNEDQLSSEDNVVDIVQQVQMLRSDHQQMKAENEQYIAENADLREKVQEMGGKIDMLEEELQETKVVVDAKNTEIASLKSEIQQAQETIAEYQSKIASTEKKNEEERKRYAAQIEKLQNELKQKESEHDQKVLELTKENCQLQLKVQSMRTDEEKLKRLLAEVTKEKVENELKLHKSESQAQIASRDETIRQSQAQIASQGETIQQSQAQIASQGETIQELQRMVSQLSMSSQTSSDSTDASFPKND